MIYRFTFFVTLLASAFFFGWWLLITLLDMPTEMDASRQNALLITALLMLVFAFMTWYIARSEQPQSPH